MALCSALGETWLVVPQMSWTSIFRPAAGALNAANAARTETIREHKILIPVLFEVIGKFIFRRVR